MNRWKTCKWWGKRTEDATVLKYVCKIPMSELNVFLPKVFHAEPNSLMVTYPAICRRDCDECPRFNSANGGISDD